MAKRDHGLRAAKFEMRKVGVGRGEGGKKLSHRAVERSGKQRQCSAFSNPETSLAKPVLATWWSRCVAWWRALRA